MDRNEAQAVAHARLAELRDLSYDDLLKRYSTDVANDPEWETATGKSGTVYNLKLYAFWDDAPGPNLRVWVDADEAVARGSTGRRPTASSSRRTGHS